MTPPPNWRAELDLARAGDRAALGRLLDAVRTYLRIIASHGIPPTLHSKEGTSDLVQQTFTEATESFALFRGESSNEWERWLRRILIDNLKMFRRDFNAIKRQVGREQSLGNRSSECSAKKIPAPDPEPVETMIAQERTIVVSQVLSRLPDKYREVILLRMQSRLSFEAIGQQLGMKGETARKVWSRAIARMGELLGTSL